MNRSAKHVTVPAAAAAGQTLAASSLKLSPPRVRFMFGDEAVCVAHYSIRSCKPFPGFRVPTGPCDTRSPKRSTLKYGIST